MGRAKKTTRRGSPEAIAKRRAARALNTLFAKGPVDAGLDGRSIRRKQRLTKELAEGRNGQTLKAHEVLSHVTELLQMGETMASIRKLKPRVPPTPPLTEETAGAIRETQESYQFDPRAWKVLGVDIDAVLSGAPVTGEGGARKRGRPRKAS
jgi:hypothetical protein